MGVIPSDIANLRAWFDASQESFNDGDAVATMTDFANSYDLTQGTPSARPTFKTGIVNGRPVFRFDGGDHVKGSTAADWKFLHDGSNFDLFIVWKTTTAEPNAMYVLFDTGAVSTGERGLCSFWDDRSSVPRNQQLVCIMAKGSTGNPVFNSAASNPVGRDANALGAKWHVSHYRLNSNNFYYGSDGIYGGGAYAGSLSGYSTSNPTSAFTLGARYNNTFQFIGDIAEVVVYNGSTNWDDTQQLIEYFRVKYGQLWEPAARSSYPGLVVAADDVAGALDACGFPGLAIADNDDLVVMYRLGSTHTSNDGIIRLRSSSDGGDTWSTASTLLSSASYDYRDASITRLQDGTLVAAGGKRDNSGNGVTDGSWVLISVDNGATWGSEITPNDNFTDYSRGGGTIVELDNGHLLLPVYGQDSGDSYTSVRVLRSTDGGATWNHLAEIADGPTNTDNYSETGLIKSLNGDILAVVRDDTNNDWRLYTSSDNGATWDSGSVLLDGVEAWPHPVRGPNDEIVMMCRYGFEDEMVLLVSEDELTTVQSGRQFEQSYTTPLLGEYGQAAFDSDGILHFVFALEAAASNSVYHAKGRTRHSRFANSLLASQRSELRLSRRLIPKPSALVSSRRVVA